MRGNGFECVHRPSTAKTERMFAFWGREMDRKRAKEGDTLKINKIRNVGALGTVDSGDGKHTMCTYPT